MVTAAMTPSAVSGRAFHRRGIGAVAIGAALVCCGAAQAQTQTGGLAAAGAPVGTDRFTLDANAGVAYDSNITGGNTTVADIRQLQPADVTYTLGTTVAFQLPSSRQVLFVNGSADFQRHQNNPILDGEDYRITGGLTERLGICAGTAVAGYSRTQSLIQDLAVATAKNIATQDNGSVDVTCGRRAIFVEVQGSAVKVTNDAKTAGFVNSTTENASVGVGYRSERLGNLAITGQYSNIDYADDPVLGLSMPSVQQYGLGLVYSRKVGLRLSGSAGVSYSRIEGGLAQTSSDGLNANISLAYRLTSRTKFTLDYSLGNSASALLNTSYVRSELIQVTGTYQLTQRISFHAAASRSKQNYREVLQIEALQLQDSTTDQFSGSADLKLGRKAVVSLAVTHTNRVADVSQFNFNDDRVAVTLTNRF
jgi:hypothetical protein